jgi:ketosteroid isomerase-like protein
MEFVAATQTEITSRESGANGEVAWVLTRSKTTGRFRGKEIASVGTETMILVRGADGAWRIVHIHWSSHGAKN